METNLIIQDGERQFNALKKASEEIAEQCNQITITDATTLAIAQQRLSLVKEKWNAVEAIRQKLKQPSLDEGRAIDKLAKPLLTPLQFAIDTGKQKILAWEQQQARLAVKESLPPPAPPKNIRKTLKFRVVDKEKMPLTWLTIDEPIVEDFKNQYKDTIKDGDIINGVLFYLEKTVIVK